MAVSRALLRLLRIRHLEEEQSRLALEAGLGALHRLERAQAAAAAQDRNGRRLLQAGIRAGAPEDRWAAIEESRSAERMAGALAPHVAAASRQAAVLRAEFLEKRVQRRQAETLVEEARTRERQQAERRSQQGLDDWFRNRMHRNHPAAGKP